MRVGRNLLFSAPALAVALLVVTTIAAADTPAPASLARGELVGLAQADPDALPATPVPAAPAPPAH